MTLTLKFRPVVWADVVGQGHVRTILKAMVATDSMPPALILGGSRGSGKTTTARILAAALNCTEPPMPGDACGACPSCKGVQSTNSMSVLEVDAASNGGVEEVRKIRDLCQYVHDGVWRVVLLDEAHCSPYDELVLTQSGEVPIGELDPAIHRLVSYRSENDRIAGAGKVNSPGFEFEKAVRRYRGLLIQFETEASRTRVTPNHVMRVRFNESFQGRWVVYLMRRGDWWRVGRTNSWDPGSPNGVSRRQSREKADAAWILGIYETKREAAIAEAKIQGSYGIPGLIFQPSALTGLSADDLADIHSATSVDVGLRIKTLMDDHGLLVDAPLYVRVPGRYGIKAKRGWFDTAAANLVVLDGCFDVPVRVEGTWTPSPKQASVTTEEFDGDVFSLDVKPHHYYVSGGAVVHNSMSKEAFNALLKILEEPPPNTVFVLITTEVDKVLETVRSRSMLFEFRRISLTDIVKRLRHICEVEGITADTALLEVLATRAHGGLRDAVMSLDQVRRAGVTDVEGYNALFQVHDIAVPFLQAAVNQVHADGLTLVTEHYRQSGDVAGLVNDLVTLTRDLLVLRSGGTPQCPAAVLSVRKALAEGTDVRQLTKVIQVLWEMKGRRHADSDQLSAMSMCFVLIADVFKAVEVVHSAPTSPVNGSVGPQDAKLTLAAMQAMLSPQTG